MDKKFKIGLIGGLVIASIFIITIVVYTYSTEYKTGDGAITKEVKNEKGEVIETIRYSDLYQQELDDMYDKMKKGNIDYSDSDVQTLVHWMANSTIKAKKNIKRGFIEPRPDNIEKLMKIIDKTDPTNGKFYQQTLSEWLKGNFIDTKDLHNKAWDCLNGEVGKAIGPDENRINQIKKDHFEK